MTFTTAKTRSHSVGHLFVISGPSGVGKGTLVAAVLKALPDIVLSISATTRPKRLGDVEGSTYHFKTEAEFDELIAQGGMLEWACIYGYRYGTLISEVNDTLATGKDMILEIDIQGNKQVKEKMPDAFSIFIAPPSLEALEQRLIARKSESKASIEQRLSVAHLELLEKESYNAVIINDDLQVATDELLTIIREVRSS